MAASPAAPPPLRPKDQRHQPYGVIFPTGGPQRARKSMCLFPITFTVTLQGRGHGPFIIGGETEAQRTWGPLGPAPCPSVEGNPSVWQALYPRPHFILPET